MKRNHESTVSLALYFFSIGAVLLFIGIVSILFNLVWVGTDFHFIGEAFNVLLGGKFMLLGFMIQKIRLQVFDTRMVAEGSKFLAGRFAGHY